MLKFKPILFFVFICNLNCWLSEGLYSQNDSTYFQLPENKKEKKEKDNEWLNKISFGGNFAFASSNRFTFIDISPIVGYRVSKILLIGAGPVYNYYSEYAYNIRYSFDMYGFRAFARVYFLENLFFQTGWDNLNRSIYTYKNGIIQKDRIWVQNIWVGGGIRYMVFSNTYMFTSVLFNLNQNIYSPYPNPYIQVGFITGF